MVCLRFLDSVSGPIVFVEELSIRMFYASNLQEDILSFTDAIVADELILSILQQGYASSRMCSTELRIDSKLL